MGGEGRAGRGVELREYRCVGGAADEGARRPLMVGAVGLGRGSRPRCCVDEDDGGEGEEGRGS